MSQHAPSRTSQFLTRGDGLAPSVSRGVIGHYVSSGVPVLGSGSFTGVSVVGSDGNGSYVSSSAGTVPGAVGSYISA
ncbi:hypothetical protein [Lacisediminihabitans sp.]|uniref:hypothetical protein n=1 Tax=Lacisediminihabitans sp. TaxID=2787631 RepID=UPI00374CD5D2